MASRSRRIRSAVRRGLLRAQRHGAAHRVIRGLCRAGARRVGARLAALPAVEAVYLRHSHPDHESFVAGASDLDATLVLEEAAADSPEVLSRIAAEAERLARLHFYLEPRDLRFTTGPELARAGRDAPFELLYRLDDWTLLAGREVRRASEPPFPARLVPWHPEFGKWWHHILQDHLLGGRAGRTGGYLRPVFRDVAKQRLQLRAALGQGDGRPPARMSDEELAAAIGSDPATADFLERLRRSRFWDADPCGSTARLVLGVLRDAAGLFRGLAPHEPGPCPRPVREDGEEHGPAYAALEEGLREAGRLRSLLRGAVAYPLPCWHPHRYQLDLLLPDELDVATLLEAVDGLVETFGGRRSRVGKASVTLSLLLEGTLSHPLAYRGLPYPLLREHVQRYGRVLLGAAPAALSGPPGREELVRACRVFVPYHEFNLRRRVEHGGAGLGFCQLAAIRLLLETGELETDGRRVRRLHREACAGSPDEAVWDYLMQEAPGRADPRHAPATRSLAEEYARVETLLHPV